MKITKVFLLGAVFAAFASTSFAAEPLHSPRAAGNQIKIANSSVATPAITVVSVDSGSAAISPRAQANQIKVVKGTNRDANPALACQKTMAGSPKAVTECTSHTTMPACNSVMIASLK